MSESPMAVGGDRPIWPLPAVTRRRWTFGASRAGGKRRHAGVDLYAPRGSLVLAPEAGEVVATQRFNGPLAVAVLLQLDSGPVILLGEVEPGSLKEMGLAIGSLVSAGQPVGRVGINPGGSQMLHYEMYTSGTRKNSRWRAGYAPPSNLLDPTAYLKRAVELDPGQQDPGIPDETPATGEVDDEDDVEIEDHDDEIPDTPEIPQLPKIPAADSPWRGLGMAAAVLGVLMLLEEIDR